MPRKGALPEREIKICDRLHEARKRSGYERAFIAKMIGVDVGALKRLELGRVPARYDLSLKLLSVLRFNAFWLATGSGTFESYTRLPTATEMGIKQENPLFTEVFDLLLKTHLDPVNSMQQLELQDSQRLVLATAARTSRMHLLRIAFNEWLIQLPDHAVKAFTDDVLRHAKLLFEQVGADQWERILMRRKQQSLLEDIERRISARDVLTNIHECVNTVDVKPQWPILKRRLQEVTAAMKGGKTRLAEFLGVKLASVSQWLTDSDNAREPGAETTLQMLQWVERQERK